MLLVTTLVLSLGFPASPVDQEVHLNLVPKGGMSKVGYYMPQRASFSPEKPAGVSKVPAGLSAPSYGTFPIGEKGFGFIVDEPKDKPSIIYVDSNGNGDFTDDPAPEWKGNPSTTDGVTTTMYSGSASIDIGEPGKPVQVNLSFYRFDPKDASRPEELKHTILYYRDYVYEGELSFGDKKFRAILTDELTSGDFRGKVPEAQAGHAPPRDRAVKLLIDRNGDGRFDSKRESYDITEPFNIGGTTWEVADMTRDGSSFRLVKSQQNVPELTLPPDHRVGKAITPFEARDTDGKTVKFPDDYKGKLVLIDFWATWCQPCMREMPNVVKSYKAHHAEGFEILGISLDDEKSIATMPDVMKKAEMDWRQVADKKGWKSDLVDRYAITGIPASYLVDGTTGTILGAGLRGQALEDAVVKALAGRKQ